MDSHDRIKQLEAALERIRIHCDAWSRSIPHWEALAALVNKEVQAVLPRPNDVF